MLSVIVLVKDSAAYATDCLQSIILSLRRLAIESTSELILLDDCSETQSGIPALFEQARNTTAAATRAIKFRSHQHYAYGVALGMSLAQKQRVLFISHDMAIAPDCIRVLLEASIQAGVGIVRPRSRHMDYYNDLQVDCPLPIRAQRDIERFSAAVARRFGDETFDTTVLIGDAMLINREVIDRIGVFDTRYFGFFADIDYGIRARRAGFRMAIAKGAWLHHVGAVVSKVSVINQKAPPREVQAAIVNRAYEKLRDKWGPTLPDSYEKMHYAQLMLLNDPAGQPSPPLYEPPLTIDPDRCDVLW